MDAKSPRPDDDPAYERLRRLQWIGEAALAHLRFDELLRELLGRVTELLSADTAAVLLLDAERNELVARAARGLEEEVEQGTRLPVGRGFAGRIAAERRSITIKDVEHSDVLNPLLREKGISSLLGVPLLVEGQVIGVLHVGSLVEREFTPEDGEMLQLAADRIAVAIDHARLYEAEREARAAAERTADRLERLEAITEAALAHLGLEQLLDELLERVQRLLATDTVALFLLEPGGAELRARAVLGVEDWGPELTVAVGEGFAGRVAAEGKPRIARDAQTDEALTPAIAASGIATILGVPLLVGGRMTGVLTVGTREVRQFAVKDVDLLQRAADRIAMAIDNARLYEAEREARAGAERAEERIRRIEAITQVALHHIELDETVLERLLARVREVLSVDTAAVLVVDDATQTLVARAAQGLAEEVERGVHVPIGSGFAGIVAERREPVIAEDAARIDVISPLLREKGVRSLLGVPLKVDDRVVGVLHVGTLEPRRFTDEDVTLLELAGDRLAVAVEHSRVWEREHLVAETLQRSLLPERLPEVAGAELSARYLAGAPEAAVGGDWYDAIPLSGGRVGLAMGDVVSRGVRAAATMGQLRHALRAYALDDRSPAIVLEGVAAMLGSLEEREMATLVYVVLDPHALTYTFASAGHPPPLVLSAGGEVEYVEEGRSPPLGAVADAAFVEASGTLAPGDTLLLYTDGLVEARDMWIDDGLARLASEVRRAGATGPEQLVDRIVRDLVPDGGADDDVAVLAVRLTALSPDRLSLRLPADPTVLTAMRRTLRQWLHDLGAGELATYDILVAATEAAANAVEHAYGPVDATFDVEARRCEGDQVEIVVRDQGRWRPPRGRNRGRGTLLMQELMQHFEVVTSHEGTEVRMRRPLTESGSEAGSEALV